MHNYRKVKRAVFFFVVLISTTLVCAQGKGTYHHFNLMVNGDNRSYLLYVPEGCDCKHALPLVFVFHGLNVAINQQIEISQMYLVADTAKFLIVYPQGLSVFINETKWQSGWIVPEIIKGPHDDVLFVSKIIDDLHLNQSFPLDFSRIYATGYSNGGQFSFYLALKLSNRIASVASVASSMSYNLITEESTPSRKVSVLNIIGDSDGFFPKKGNELFPPITGVTDFWARINGCCAKPDSIQLDDVDESDNSIVTLFEYPNCNLNTEVELLLVNGGGHTWPGGGFVPLWVSDVGVRNNDINASAEIWKFFKRNPLYATR
jgi:polyhydroxybutyrate depolymerase